MKSCALLTCEKLEGSILDEDRLENALKETGWSYQWIQWKDQSVDWSQYDCAIIRTTWDYTEDLPFFLDQLQKITDQGCRLFNSMDLVNWNTKKTYLKELAEKGVSVIPTKWDTLNSKDQLPELLSSMDATKVVIKPQVGASAIATYLLSPTDESLFDQIFKDLDGKAVMVQPYMENVAKQGEHSAHFFGGEFSHMVLKTPKDKDFRSQEEYGSYVRKIELSEIQEKFCKTVLENIPGDWLYARVDFINDSNNRPCLIELELVEPSLYFRYDDQSATRLVKALNKRF